MTMMDTLFGRKAQRAPARRAVPLARAPLAWLGRAGGEAARNWSDEVEEAYLANPVAQRAVRLVAEGVSSAPLTASAPELLALVRAASAGQTLLETLAAQLQLHGNAFVQPITDGAGRLTELFALRPDRMRIVAGEDGWPIAYDYRVGGRVVRLPAEDAAGRPAVVHIRTFHPTDDHYGCGALGAAGGAVRAHNAAARWNRALLDNAARPSGVLVYDPGEAGATLSDAQFERLRTEMEAGYQGAANAGRPMLLEGGLKWQAIGLTPAEMDFARLKEAAARDVAMAFGVPPMLIGLPGDATYANYREASRALWRLTILPLADRLLRAIGEATAPWFPGATLSVDLNQVSALSEDRERLWQQVAAAEFLSSDEKRSLLGLAPAAATASNGKAA